MAHGICTDCVDCRYWQIIACFYGTHTHTHTFICRFFWTTRVGRYQKGKTNLDFTEARDSQWQWHQLSHMQVCTLFQTDNHASTSPLSFLQAGCPSCHPTNSIKALKAYAFTALFNKLSTLFSCRLWSVHIQKGVLTYLLPNVEV